MEIINWRLLSHPVNWGIVWVFLLLAATAYAFIHDGVRDSVNANGNIIPN